MICEENWLMPEYSNTYRSLPVTTCEEWNTYRGNDVADGKTCIDAAR